MSDVATDVSTRLLIASATFPPLRGGIERFVEGLAAHVWPTSTTVVAPPSPLHEHHDAAAPYGVVRAPFLGTRPPRWLPARRAIAKAMSDCEPAVVLAGQRWPDARALATVRRRSEIRVAICHGTEVILPPGAVRARRLARRTLAALDVVLANSAYTAELAARLGTEARVLNPGVDLDAPELEMAEVREKFGLGEGPLVVTVARLVPRKGHVEFVRTWRQIEQKVPSARWVIIGDGPERQKLEHAANDRRIDLIGEVDDAAVRALCRTAAVHLLPATTVGTGEVEGFGMVVSEAGAVGTPTVAADIGGTAEAIGKGGVVVPQGRPDLLMEAVVQLVEDDAQRKRLGVQARARAEMLAWPVVAQRFREFVQPGGR